MQALVTMLVCFSLVPTTHAMPRVNLSPLPEAAILATNVHDLKSQTSSAFDEEVPSSAAGLLSKTSLVKFQSNPLLKPDGFGQEVSNKQENIRQTFYHQAKQLEPLGRKSKYRRDDIQPENSFQAKHMLKPEQLGQEFRDKQDNIQQENNLQAKQLLKPEQLGQEFRDKQDDIQQPSYLQPKQLLKLKLLGQDSKNKQDHIQQHFYLQPKQLVKPEPLTRQSKNKQYNKQQGFYLQPKQSSKQNPFDQDSKNKQGHIQQPSYLQPKPLLKPDQLGRHFSIKQDNIRQPFYLQSKPLLKPDQLSRQFSIKQYNIRQPFYLLLQKPSANSENNPLHSEKLYKNRQNRNPSLLDHVPKESDNNLRAKPTSKYARLSTLISRKGSLQRIYPDPDQKTSSSRNYDNLLSSSDMVSGDSVIHRDQDPLSPDVLFGQPDTNLPNPLKKSDSPAEEMFVEIRETLLAPLPSRSVQSEQDHDQGQGRKREQEKEEQVQEQKREQEKEQEQEQEREQEQNKEPSQYQKPKQEQPPQKHAHRVVTALQPNLPELPAVIVDGVPLSDLPPHLVAAAYIHEQLFSRPVILGETFSKLLGQLADSESGDDAPFDGVGIRVNEATLTETVVHEATGTDLNNATMIGTELNEAILAGIASHEATGTTLDDETGTVLSDAVMIKIGSEDVKLTETTLDGATETVPDDATETVSDDRTEAVSDDATETVPDDVAASAPADATETVSDDAAATVSDDATATGLDGTETALDTTSYCETAECVQMMQEYEEWRKANGYGTVGGRWG